MQTDNHRVYLVAFFKAGIRGNLFDASGNNVANAGETVAILAVYRKHVDDFGASVICYFNPGSYL